MADLGPAIRRIEFYADGHWDVLETPGLAIGLTDRDRCLGTVVRGLASIEAGSPVLPEHRFQIGSISKGFTAMALLRQREAGRVDLESPVSEYLPWFAVRSPYEPITLHHLLTHTSGLISGMDFTGEGTHEVWSLRDSGAGFAPGERFWYSNVGYKTLGLVLERVAGQPWWGLVRSEVMEPIGMGDADVIITQEGRSRLASGYSPRYDDRPWQPRHGWVPGVWSESATADGTICATAEELTAYARLLLNDGAGVLSPGSFALMTTPVIEDDTQPGHVFGYGIKWVDGRYLGHSGSMIGYSAYVLTEPGTGFGVTVLMNAIGSRLDLCRFALECLAAADAGSALPEVPEPQDRGNVADAADYAGFFESGGQGALPIVADGERLFLDAAGGRVRLARLGGDLFTVDSPALDRFAIRFARDDGGAVTEAFFASHWFANERYAGPTTFEHPPGWEAFTGHYRSWNPWAPNFRIVLRKGLLAMQVPNEIDGVAYERELTPLADGDFRVGEPWSPDRIRFDTVIDTKATRAVYDCAPFYRTFTP